MDRVRRLDSHESEPLDISPASDHVALPSDTHHFNIHGYARAVYKYSKMTNGAGYNHGRLARFFAGLLTATPDRNFQPAQTQEGFLTLYRFDSKPADVTLRVPDTSHIDGRTHHRDMSADTVTDVPTKWLLRRATHITSCHDLQHYPVPLSCDSPGQLVFMKGFPSPEWLGLMGSKYRIDPEFFNRYLDFRPIDDRTSDFSVPSLPTRAWNIVDLSLMTIGLRDTISSYGEQCDISSLRKGSANALAESHHRILRGDAVPVGSSVTREVSVLDEKNFAIEQRISICLQPPENNRGWLAFIWADNGIRTSENIIDGPLAAALNVRRPLKSSLLPIVNYRPFMGLDAHLLTKHHPSQTDDSSDTSRALHLGYGRSLRMNVAARDPFYALKEVFELVASSEQQFLNMAENKLEKAIHTHDAANPGNLANLRYFNTLLYRHTRQIKAAILSIGNTKHAKWPKADDGVTKRVRTEVEQDYLNLHEHADRLYRRCQEEIAVLMNSMAISESEKAIMQAERIGKLTFMAFFFVPISFTSSFFSMNTMELQKVSLWSWFVMSVGILFFSLIYLVFDTRDLLSRAQRFKARVTGRVINR